MKIDMGNFGFSHADPAPRVRVPAGAFDAGGDAMARAGDRAMQAATMAMDKAMEEEKMQENALTRAKAANAVLDREIATKTISQNISDEIAAGSIPYQDGHAEYQRRVGELEIPTFQNLDPVMNENLQKGLKRADFIGQNTISAVIKAARVADFKSQTEGILDKLGKQAGLPGADVGALNTQIDEMDEIGGQAYGAAWAKRKQEWKDTNWNDHLNQKALTVRDDLKGIEALQQQIAGGEYADKLDSGKRNTLMAKLDGYRTSLIQRNEAAAARSERLYERQLKRAEAEFNTFTAMVDKGTILSPDYINRVTTITAGTPYQQGIVAMAKQAQENGGLAAQPLQKQQATLDVIDALIAKNGRTPELDKRREQIQKVLSGSVSDLRDNGLRAGLERGVITDLAPLDTSTPEAIASSMAQRIEQAQTVSAWAGKPVSPLDSNEAENVRKMLDALPAKQKSQAITTIAEAVGPKMSGAIAAQLDGKDKALSLAFATSGSKTTADRYTSELILKGSSAIKDKAVMQDDKRVTGWRATIANYVNGAFSDERTATQVKDAAWFIAAGIASENGGSVSTSDLERAVQLAMHGNIIERNGKKLPVPAGFDESSFEKQLKNVSAADILKQAPDGKVRVAGVNMPAEEFAKGVPGQELIYAGPGKYAVVVRGRPAMNSAGRPILIGVQ